MTNAHAIAAGKSVVLGGKLKGFLYTTVDTQGNIHRVYKPKYNTSIHKAHEEEKDMKIAHTPYSTHKQESSIKKVEHIDVPEFMKQRSNELYRSRKAKQHKQTFKDVLNRVLHK